MSVTIKVDHVPHSAARNEHNMPRVNSATKLEIRNNVFSKDSTGKQRYSHAVGYFNREVLQAKEMTWNHVFELYRLILGEEKNDTLLQARVQSAKRQFSDKLRMNYVGIDFEGGLLDLANTTFGTKEEVVHHAPIFYFDALGLNHESPGMFTHVNGFQKYGKRSLPGQNEMWYLMMNYFLIKNGYTPFYFEDRKELDEIYMSKPLAKFVDERTSKTDVRSTM